MVARRVRSPAPDARREVAGVPGLHVEPRPSAVVRALRRARRRRGRTTDHAVRLSAGGAEVAPDGKHVLFRSTDASGELTPGNAVYTVGLDGRGLRRITKPSASSYVLTGSYSPDGRSLVFATNAGATGSFADVFTLDLATGRRIQVTHTPNLDGWPTWGRAAT